MDLNEFYEHTSYWTRLTKLNISQHNLDLFLVNYKDILKTTTHDETGACGNTKSCFKTCKITQTFCPDQKRKNQIHIFAQELLQAKDVRDNKYNSKNMITSILSFLNTSYIFFMVSIMCLCIPSSRCCVCLRYSRCSSSNSKSSYTRLPSIFINKVSLMDRHLVCIKTFELL